MSWVVYILYSYKDKRLYVGCSSDITERLKRHEHGYVRATAHRRPLVLIHSESFTEKGSAFQRERFLKSLWSGREKKQILKRYLAGLNQRGA